MSHVRHFLARPAVSAAACITIAVLLGGCQDILFPKDAPRTQFSNYDRMRNEYAPEREMDALGREVPALRARLSPH
jgi:hypothetical protein